MGEGSTTTLATILTAIGDVVTSAIGWMGDFVDFIVANPLVMIFIIVAFVGLAVGLLRRLISL